jgi:hypothetical protein
MGSLDYQIAALQDGSAANAAGNGYVPTAPAASPVLAAREVPTALLPKTDQDSVSLSGTPPPQPQLQNVPSRGSAQPAAFALLAQTTTFPPSQNSSAAFATSGFPPAAPATLQSNAPAVAATPSTPAGGSSPVAIASANATLAPANASTTAPAQQTLQQLDRVLQQLGIDPQSLSLISREGMLSWVNDPAALRQIVQNVQAAANSSQQNAAVGATNPTLSAAQLAVTGVNQTQIQPQTQNQPQASVREASTASDDSQSGSSANTNALGQSAATAQQNATAVMQIQKLQDLLAPGGTPETQSAANSVGTTTAPGQYLNVSA